MKKYLTLIVGVLIVLFFALLYFLEIKKDDNSNLKKITVAEVTHSVFYAPQYVAINKGYFKEEGLDINLILTSGADNVMAAVLSKDADIGLSGSEATIYVYNSGEKDYIKTFAQLTRKDGSFLVSRKKIDNFTLEDLRGKMIIGGRVGGMPLMMLEYSLKENGIDPKKDVEIDTSIQFAAMSGAFIGGTGDFVSLFEPLATKLENEGYGFIVASLGDFGGVVPYTAYNARKSFIENNPDVIEKFNRAIKRGLEFVNTSSSKEIADAIKDSFLDTSYNDLVKAIDRYKKINAWPNDTTFSEESFNHLQDIVVSYGALDEKSRVSYKDLVYEK